MAATTPAKPSSSSGPSSSNSASIKSSFTFPARPAQQQEQQQQYNTQQQTQYQQQQYSTAIAPYIPPSTFSPTTACTSFVPPQSQHQYQQQYAYASSSHHAQQPSLSNISRKSSSSSGDPFAYDRASLRATASISIVGGGSRHTPRSSIASLSGVQNSTSATTSPALSCTGSIAALGDKNKDLPPQPAASPVKDTVPISEASSSSTIQVQPASPLIPTYPPPPPPPPAEYVQALHDYSSAPAGGAANVCLSFRAGDFIKVLNRDASGWWDGEIQGTRGWFPSNYVVSSTNNAQ